MNEWGLSALCKYLHCSEFILDRSLDLESISEKYISLLCEDREDEFIIVLETIREVIERHDGVFHLLSEKCLFEKIIKFDLIEVSDDEYIDDIIRGLIAKIQYRLRYRHEIEIFSSLEKVLYWGEYIVGLEKHIDDLLIDRAGMIHHIVLLLILLVWLQDPERFEVHQLTSDGIDLLICISTEFSDKKSDTRSSNDILDNEFFEKFDARTRAKKFDEIQEKKGEYKRSSSPEYIAMERKCKGNTKKNLYIYL